MANDNRLIEFFLDLVRINALSGEERPVADYIIEHLRNLGLDPQEDQVNKNNGGSSGNVLCRVGEDPESVLLSHMDTARPTAGVHPVVTDDRITSDGNTVLGVDNRSGIAILLATVEQAVAQPAEFSDFLVCFTICEETSLLGSKGLVLPETIRMGYAFDSSLRPGHFIHGSYGAKRFNIEIHGKAAHSGIEPENGINAIQVAARGIDNIPHGRIDEVTTINLASIAGGSAINVVPDEVTLSGEIRSRDRETIDSILSNVEERFRAVSDEFNASATTKSEWDFVPYKVDEQDAAYQRLVNAYHSLGLEPVPHITPAGSDANSLNGKGIPSLNIGIGAQNPHSNDEFILLEDFHNGRKIADALLRK